MRGGVRGSTGSPRIDWIGVASTVFPPKAPIVSVIAPAMRGVPSAPVQVIGEPENPGPTPVSSTAGPETGTRMRPVAGSDPGAITSSTRASNVLIAAPWITEATLQAFRGARRRAA